ncbi:NADP-dependent oxidoreductase [Mesorhizobium abyssinicae]|uniref:NADP-dependent oxidoreductase n=1 Tax=Mesorhizobium abyssinicae TaxID=1209958 RepID=UPI003396585C
MSNNYPSINRQVILKARPKGMPTQEDFGLIEAPIPKPGPGQVLVRNLLLSLDPYMRGIMDEGESYQSPVPLGEVMRGHTVSQVVTSRAEGFVDGDIVFCAGQWQDYSVQNPQGAPPPRKIDVVAAPAAAWLGPMGLPGWTAYVGLFDLSAPRPGETLVVSAASGAVGSLVGQLAKSQGLRVVGIAGGPSKCAYAVKELRFDACVDYKAPDFAKALAGACPSGIDIDFENAGGPVLEAIWPLLNPGARVVVCGLIAQYNATTAVPGPDLTWLLKRRITMRGFIISDHRERLPKAIGDMLDWYRNGKLTFREDVVEGLENAPEVFIGMLQGRNFGKLLVRLNEPQ